MPKDPVINPAPVLAPKPVQRARASIFNYVLLTLIATFGILTYFAKQFNYFRFDLQITLAIQQISFPGFDPLMRFITMLGNEFLGGLVLMMGATVALLSKKNRDALLLVGASLGAVGLSELVKNYVSRPRPDPLIIQQIGQFVRNDSFPSGHVMFETTMYGFLLFMAFTKLKKQLWLRRLFITTLSIPIALVGISRIYLGAHWFSDVLGAYVLAAVWLYLTITVHNQLEKKKAKSR